MVQPRFASGSITIVSDFNTSYVMVQHTLAHPPSNLSFGFQYILCYGSTLLDTSVPFFILYFNTSYVMVQLNTSRSISSSTSDFNTSYVMVQLSKSRKSGLWHLYFNTSYVMVQRAKWFSHSVMSCDFNTSYVMVQPKR